MCSDFLRVRGSLARTSGLTNDQNRVALKWGSGYDAARRKSRSVSATLNSAGSDRDAAFSSDPMERRRAGAVVNDSVCFLLFMFYDSVVFLRLIAFVRILRQCCFQQKTRSRRQAPNRKCRTRPHGSAAADGGRSSVYGKYAVRPSLRECGCVRKLSPGAFLGYRAADDR